MFLLLRVVLISDLQQLLSCCPWRLISKHPYNAVDSMLHFLQSFLFLPYSLSGQPSISYTAWREKNQTRPTHHQPQATNTFQFQSHSSLHQGLNTMQTDQLNTVGYDIHASQYTSGHPGDNIKRRNVAIQPDTSMRTAIQKSVSRQPLGYLRNPTASTCVPGHSQFRGQSCSTQLDAADQTFTHHPQYTQHQRKDFDTGAVLLRPSSSNTMEWHQGRGITKLPAPALTKSYLPTRSILKRPMQTTTQEQNDGFREEARPKRNAVRPSKVKFFPHWHPDCHGIL